MLKSLHIENIAIIEETNIDFINGFNCLTGETGAGKSIIIDAINAVLGERTSKDIIRTGCDKAFVSALFCDLSDDTLKLLAENGFSADESGELLITRSITSDGNSVKINGRPSSIGVLKQISRYLVNIHGQHDNQTLLIPENHIKYIDKIADNKALLDEYYNEFHRLNAIRKELNSLEMDEGEKLRRIENLKFEINEIESAALKTGELEALKEKLKVINDFEKVSAALNSAFYSLNGTDDSLGAVSLIKNAQFEVSKLDLEGLSAAKSSFGDVLATLENIAFDIKSVLSENDFSPADAENIRDRISAINSLVRKYGGSEESALVYLSGIKDELEEIKLSDKRINELSVMLDKSTEKLVEKASVLTKTRNAAAKSFSDAVSEKLKYLNMESARFSVALNKGRYTKSGCDTAEFMIKTNAGDTEKPLVKIASGGELARIMLAIKSVLNEKDDIDTLIFDEIDSGISGRAADKVGNLLKGVSNTRQVICVTHLAQIAGYAKNHLLIEKQSEKDRTYTLVKPLSYEERIEEIARIMSGTEITDNLYKSAKELLDRSR